MPGHPDNTVPEPQRSERAAPYWSRRDVSRVTPSGGNVEVWDTTERKWMPKSLSGGTGITVAETTAALTITGHASLTIGADAEHSLAAQVLSGVDAAAAQKGHIQLAGELGGTAAAPTVAAAHGGTHAIGQGGTGQTTAQAAIDALTGVAGATAEHVLTKDTATGNAKFKAAAAGGSGHTIRENGVNQTARTGLNFIDADAGAGLITDDAGGDETEVNLNLYLLKATAAAAVRTIILTAAAGRPTTTAPCGGPNQVEFGTNDVDLIFLDFDSTTVESAFWPAYPMPLNWDGLGTLTAVFIWTNASGLTTETVAWGIKARCYADSDAIDQAYGTEVVTSDTWLAQNDVHISAASTAITPSGTLAGGNLIQFKVSRKTASDNLTGDARLIAVRISYTTDTFSDV